MLVVERSDFVFQQGESHAWILFLHSWPRGVWVRLSCVSEVFFPRVQAHCSGFRMDYIILRRNIFSNNMRGLDKIGGKRVLLVFS